MGQLYSRRQGYEELEPVELEEKRRPIAQVEDVDSSPFEVLKRLHIIKQRGRVRGDLVEYDKGKWVHAKSRKGILCGADESIHDHIYDKHDVQPIAVIRVVGKIDFHTFVTSTDLKKQTEKQRIFQELSTVPGIFDQTLLDGGDYFSRNNTVYMQAASGYEALLDSSDDEQPVAAEEQPPPVRNVKEYKAWRDGLQKHQIGRFLKQYLQRAVPSAAKAIGGMILVTDDIVNTHLKVAVGDIAKSLNRGMYAAKKQPTGDECLQSGANRSDYFSSDPVLLGVHTWLTETKDDSTPPQPVEVAIEQIRDELSEFSAHLFLTEQELVVAPARKSKVLDFTTTMMKVLQDGSDPEGWAKEAMPFRLKCTGSCIVLMGGDVSTSVLEIQQASEQGTPVLVIEGSGGYADVLCNTIRRVEEVVGSPSLDDYRNCLGTISPRTSNIINSGCIKVVAKGTSTEEFQKMVEKSVTHDETLHAAWLKYAVWDYNSQYCRKLFIHLQVLVLFLGILATTLSIFQTFLQLQYPNETGSTTTSSTVGQIYTWVGLIVVVLPVGLSLVEAIENKLNAGGRWVALRTASETLLREIYMYRTQVRSYSHQAIKRSIEKGNEEQDPVDSSKHKEEEEEETEEGPDASVDKKVEDNLTRTDHRSYKTRQEKLSHWMEHLIAELKESECANNTLQKYNGPLPPWHIQDTQDDGWRDLVPDEYVAYRLAPLIARYERAAKYYEAQLSWFTISNYVLGAVGTLLAALSSVPPLDTYNLQAWVALTTGMSSAATRYMDYARMDFLQKKSNKIKMELEDVQSWWDSRGNEAGTQQVRNDLVTQVEALVTGEFVEWGGQMKKAMDKSKKDRKDKGNNEISDLISQVKEDVEQEAQAQIKELGLTDITADSLAAALEDPTGPEGVKIFDSMTRLTAHIDKTTGLDSKKLLEGKFKKEALHKLEALQNVSDQFLDDTGNLLNINLGGMALSDFVPTEIEELVKNPKERRKMFRDVDIINPAVLSRKDCLSILGRAGADFKKKVSDLPQRQMLETMKSSIVDQLHEELINGLKNFKICIYDLIPRDELVTELLLELRDLGKVEWREMSSTDILCLVKNKEIHSRMKDLNEVALRGLMKRADKLFKSKTAQVFQSVMEKVSRLDVEELFDTTEKKAEVFDTLEDLQGDKDICFFSKEALLAKLPERISVMPHIRNKPQAQIVEYIQTVKCGFSASRIFQAFRNDFKSENTESVLNSILKNKRLCDRFVFAVKSIGQLEINRCDKKMLMRKLAMSPAFSQEMIDELKYLGEPTLKRLMSGLKSFISNSYQGRVFDILCDEVTTFDLRNLLPDAEDRERFVNQVREFRGVVIREASKEELITTIAYQTLILKFLKLSVDQIRELVERALVLMGNSFHSSIFTTAVMKYFDGDLVLNELEKWDEESTDRLCVCLLKLPGGLLDLLPPGARDVLDHVSQVHANDVGMKVLTQIADQSLHGALGSWGVDVQLRVLSQMQSLLGERVLANVFETSSRELPKALASKFHIVFTDPRKREYMLHCLTSLTQMDFADISDLSTVDLVDTMENGDSTKRDFLNLLVSIIETSHGHGQSSVKGAFKMLVLHLLNEILITVPYRLFLKLCLQITSFDLREVLDDPQSRRLVAVVFLRCSQIGELHDVENMKGRDILDACDSLLEYEMVVNDIRMLAEDQLRLLVHEMLDFFKAKQIGTLFARFLEDHQSAGAHKVEYGTLIEAVISIKGHLQISPVKVRTDFRFFDSEQFFSVLTEEEKVAVLQKYIPDDSAVRKIAQFSQLQFRRLFAHMCAVPCSQAEHGQGNQYCAPVDMRQHQMTTQYGKGVADMIDKMDKIVANSDTSYNV